jgi:preprotein translocase subunit SecD
MTTIRELLADADPLRDRAGMDPAVRDAMRLHVVAAAGAAGRTRERHVPSRRAFLLASAAALVIAGVATGPAWWPDGGTVHAAVPFEIRVAEADPRPGLQAVQDAAASAVYVEPRVVVANGDITRTRVVAVGDGFGVEIAFTADGAARMRAVTAGNVGRLLAVVVDGRVLASPRITSAIDEVGILGGRYTKDEADRIAAGLVPR